jgi:mono/diheme cytochrome c family protein
MAGALMKALVVVVTFFLSVVAYAEPLPLLHLQPEVLDMGSVKEGEEATGTLFIRNNSDTTITITDVQTSCGCTVAEPKSKILAPGAFTELEVTIDSTVKKGEVKKSIRVTDSLGHVAKATLKLTVEENPHLIRNGRGIFDGKCAACHFDPVVGKEGGRTIYDAACAMCHGELAKGAYAPALRGHDDVTALQYVIAQGTGSPQMPGFAIDAGGPLTQKQISILSRWLLSLD